MKVNELEKIINDAFEDKQNISDSSDKKILDAINETINLTDKGTLYDTTTLFTAESTSANGRYIYTRPEVTINNDNNLWLYFGTGNTQKLQSQSSQVKNRLYGIKDKNFPNFVKVNPAGDISKCKTAPTCPNDTDLGWYVDLKKSQKLTAEPTVDRDRVYYPVYEPTAANNKCGTGAAILMASHDIFRVRETCNRIGIIKNGELVKEMDTSEVSTNELESIYIDYMPVSYTHLTLPTKRIV